MVYATINDFIPNQALRYRRLRKGDRLPVLHQQGESFKVGTKYKNIDNFIVAKVIYEPKKWWQFWKSRKPIGYIIECIKD